MPRKFEIISEMQDVEIIAVGDAIRERNRLNRAYASGKLTRWRKMKGFAWVRYHNGVEVRAEVHWFEAHGIGRREEKVKREIRR
jgi:hypothetical protein